MQPPRTPPTLIVGMHRSGTSLLTGLLQSIGLFVGWRLDSHRESTFHQRINRRLTAEAGGHWSQPEMVADIVARSTVREFADPLRPYLDGVPAIEYWGRRYRSRVDPSFAWGWKDPRNGYLLPIWRSIYPELQVIWIRRDPRETAESLYRRAAEIRSTIEDASSATGIRSTVRRARVTYQGHPILADAWRAMTAEGCVDIALGYERVHQRHLGRGQLEVLTFDYSRLVTEPVSVLESCAERLGLRPSQGALERAVAAVSEPALDRTGESWKAIERASLARRDELAELGYP